jgi:hypothetical protein
VTRCHSGVEEVGHDGERRGLGIGRVDCVPQVVGWEVRGPACVRGDETEAVAADR